MNRQQRRQRQRAEPDPAGTIGIVSSELARFTDFAVSMLKLARPPGTRVIWQQGLDVTANFNMIIDGLEGDWLWIMGDDHVFEPHILLQLLARDVDVIVPLCLKKRAPFEPVVYGHEETDEEGVSRYYEAELPRNGVVEVHAAGSAGMLIRKHVLDRIGQPVFETSGVRQDEDLILCRKIREAGFKIYCDVDARLGHIGVFGVYPMWQNGWYGAALDLGAGQVTPLFRMLPREDVELAARSGRE